MNADTMQQAPLRRTDLAYMSVVATRFEDAMKSESLALILWCFEKAPSLQAVDLTVTACQPKTKFGPLTYVCSCQVELDQTPSTLMLPQFDSDSLTVNVVGLFRQAGACTDEQFRIALADYFNSVWPAFDDRAHLFGGVGSFKVTRKDATDILNGNDPAEIYQRLRALVE